MNVAVLDPKLLPLLDAVLDEIHLARAAARVGLPLPAAANALERCRQLLGDPLLQDGGQGMQLTALAHCLRAPVRQALIGHGVRTDAPPSSVPTVRTIRIAIPDYPAQTVLPALYAQLQRCAPQLDLVVPPWAGQAVAAVALESGACDLAIGADMRGHGNLRSRTLRQERCVVVMRHDHPAAHQLTLRRWLAYPHLVVSTLEDLNRSIDEQLATHGQRRRVAMVVPHFLMSVPLLHGSDLIAAMPMHCVPAANAAYPDALACLRPPLPIADSPLHLLRHRRSDDDDAVHQVAQLLERLLKQPVTIL